MKRGRFVLGAEFDRGVVISPNWQVRFELHEPNLVLLNFSKQGEGASSDWQRFFQERHAFLESLDGLRLGWVEVWRSEVGDIDAPSVNSRHLLYRFLESSVGQLAAWVVGCDVLRASLKTCCSLPEACFCPFPILWTDRSRARLAGEALAKDHLDRLNGSSSLVEEMSGLWLLDDGFEKKSVFGMLNSENVEPFLSMLRSLKGEIDVSELNLGDRKVRLRWEEELPCWGEGCKVLDRRIGGGARRRSALEDQERISAVLSDNVQSLRRQVLELERKVRQERDRRDALLASKIEFLSVVNQNFREPINLLISKVERLMKSDLDDQQRSEAEGISSSSMEIFTQFNRMLDFEKYRSGGVDFQERSFSLEPLLNKGLSAQEERALAKGLVFQLEVAEMIGDAFGDGDRLLTMLQNLVDDGIDATEEGAVKVSVSCVYPSVTDVVVRVEVVDDGQAIMKIEEGNSLGTMVSLGCSKSVRTREMGLFVCEKMAIAMGGRMGTGPNSGGGTIVWFEVRLRRQVQISTPAGSAKNKTLNEKLAQKTVLIVDDNPISRKVLVKHLHAMGLHVEVTGSGHAALELMKTQPYDLAILDMAVHDVDNDEMISCLQGVGGVVPPLFGMVAQSHGGVAERCLDMGFDAIIKKPLEARLLREMVIEALSD